MVVWMNWTRKSELRNHFSPVSKAIFQKTFILWTKVAQCPFIFQVTSVYYKHSTPFFLTPTMISYFHHNAFSVWWGRVHGNLQIHSCNPIALNSMNIYCYLLPFKREHVFLDSGHRILMARLVQITTCVTILGRVRSNKNESDQTQEHIHTVRSELPIQSPIRL